MEVNQCIAGRIEDRVADEPRNPERIGEYQHCQRRVHITFAGPDQSKVVELAVRQASFSRSTHTIRTRGGLCPFLYHDVLHRQVQPSRVDYLLLRWLDYGLGLTKPISLGLGLSVLDIHGLVGLDGFLDCDWDHLNTQLFLDLFSRTRRRRSKRPAYDDDARLPKPRRHTHQRNYLVKLAPVTRRQDNNLLARLAPLGEVHPSVTTERLREHRRLQPHIDDLVHRLLRRPSSMPGKMEQQDAVGIFQFLHDLCHLSRRNHFAADELHIAQFPLHLSEVFLELGYLFGRPRQVNPPRPANVDLVDFHGGHPGRPFSTLAGHRTPTA
ncbi:hypothetical protein ES703_43333 [subsurface metagenome]